MCPTVVIVIFIEFFKFCTVVDEVLADKFCNILGELGVGLAEPAPVSNTVCYVCELLRSDLVEVVEDSVLQDLAVESRNTVYGVADCHTEVGHADDTV